MIAASAGEAQAVAWLAPSRGVAGWRSASHPAVGKASWHMTPDPRHQADDTPDTPPHDARFARPEGEAVFAAPQMLLKAALEQGVEVAVTARLGGPDPAVELLESHRAWLAQQGVEVLVLPDASLALAAARGAADAGRSCLVLLDGAAVASAGQALFLADTGESAQDRGGVVLAVGPSDAAAGRALCDGFAEAGLAVFEPGLHVEVVPWLGTALSASVSSGRPTVLGLARELWSGFASVELSPNAGSDRAPSGVSPVRSKGRESAEVVVGLARACGANRVLNPPSRDESLPMGLVAGGVGYARLRQVVSELGLVGRLPILRLGLTGPLDTELLDRHARDCQRLVVVDHRDGGLYRRVSGYFETRSAAPSQPVEALLPHADPSPAAILAGLAPRLREHPGMPRELIDGALSKLENQVAGSLTNNRRKHPDPDDHLPPPGSALVDVAAVLGRLRRDLADAQYMSEQHGLGPLDVAVYGELDDPSRLLIADQQPVAGGSRLPGELAGGAAHAAPGAAGEGSARPVVLMNGRELFASGYTAIASAVRLGRAITFVIHTEEPARPKSKRWYRRRRRRRAPGVLDLEQLLGALGDGAEGDAVTVGAIDPSDRPRLRRLLERSMVGAGVHVILARRREGPRALRKAAAAQERSAMRDGFVPTQQRLVLCPEVWPLNTAQRLQLGPLGLEPAPREPGGWMTAASWAWGGASVLRALVNPALGLVTVQRTAPERSRLNPSDLEGLPPLPRPEHADQEVWRATVAGVAGTGLEQWVRLLVEAGSAMGYRVRGSLDPAGLAVGQGARVEVTFGSRPRGQELSVAGAPGRSTQALFSAVPTPGSADLVLGVEGRQARRVLAQLGDGSGAGVVSETAALPTLRALVSGEPGEPEGGPGASADGGVAGAHRLALPMGELCEYFWGHRRYSAWVAMGVALQRGLAPLTRRAVTEATRRIGGGEDPRCAEAFEVGRKLAVDPGFAERVLSRAPDAPETVLQQVTEDLAQQHGGRSGPVLSREFHGLVAPLLERCALLDADVRRRMVQSAGRCVAWGGRRGGVAYAKRYCETITLLLDHDHADRGYDLTRRGIEGAARAMLVPDEVYLAALLTSPARYRRDRHRLNIALEQGDKVTYRHMVRPEFDIFKRHVAFNLTLGERSLRLLARLHVVRRVRTGWYREQRDFRDDYLQTLAGVADTSDKSGYRKWCEIASAATGITGRGEQRRANVADARALLDRLVIVDAKHLAGE